MQPVARVGGSAEAGVEALDFEGARYYRAGVCEIITPLPNGYPRPTPPGAMEIKWYPSVRRAELTGVGGQDDGMYGKRTTRTFWPLFNHIKRRDIAMTAPVEMDYRRPDDAAVGGGWSMSFLYRRPELGPTGRDGDIRVFDTAPVTVLAIGVRGPLQGDRIGGHLEALRQWIDAQDTWVVAGDPRTLGYNGPEARAADRWHEVQVPIARRGLAEAMSPPRSGGSAPPRS
jgi:hypothetical protein